MSKVTNYLHFAPYILYHSVVLDIFPPGVEWEKSRDKRDME
jgi:hypothetical protein